MEIPSPPSADVLALPVRLQLVTVLTELLRPATTQELAERIGRHPNTVRLQRGRLAEAGLLERRTVTRRRGRPRHEWAVAADARPGGEAPQAYARLAAWLAIALTRPPGLAEVEQVGREAGRELAPSRGRPVGDAMQDALAALGFAPRHERPGEGRHRYVLRNCPYRGAVRASQPAVCALHRGITTGLLEGVDPGATLVAFVPSDPDAAGCLIEVQEREGRGVLPGAGPTTAP